MGIKDVYNKVKKEVDSNPRKCEICGKVETMEDLILKYDNGKFMCDDCMLKYYENEELEEQPEIEDPKEKEIRAITERINDFYGSDAMYYNVDSYAIAGHLHDHGCRIQQHAQWLKYGNKHTCSACGYNYWSNNDDFKYCPDCGAKMKGGME